MSIQVKGVPAGSMSTDLKKNGPTNRSPEAKKTPGKFTPTRTVGPVPDLERHLPADWWRTLFNSIYLKTDGDVVENDGNTAREVDALIRAIALEPMIESSTCAAGKVAIVWN